MKNVDMIIPEWLIQEPIGKKLKNIYNCKLLIQLERNIILLLQLDDNELNRELV